MKEKVIILVLCFLFGLPLTSYATENNSSDCVGESKTSTNGKNYSHLHEHCYTDKDTIHHDHREDPAGVGADILLVEGKNLDVVAEYKYDFNNEEHSTFGVFKTKKALWDIIKGFFNKGE